MPHIKIPGIYWKMFVYVFKIFLNFRISENQLKKQAMSAAERKRNKRKRKMEQMNDDKKEGE